MEENNNTIAAATEKTIESIKTLINTIGNDDDLKQKLEDLLVAMTGKTSDSLEEQTSDRESESPQENEKKLATVEEGAGKPEDADSPVDTDDGEEKDEDISSELDSSDIFNGDAAAGMFVGLVAGAAMVGGGILLHKLITDD